MTAEHERLEGKHQRLNPQEQCVHQAKCIDGMQDYLPDCAGTFGRNDVVVIGINVGNATAARRHIVGATFVKGLKKREQRARSRHLLRIDELFAAAELAGGNVVLQTS